MMKKLPMLFLILMLPFVQVLALQGVPDRDGWEKRFREIPNPDSLREYMRRLSARPHHLGSPYDKDNAEWLLRRFKDWGFDAHIETFYVLFPTPKDRSVELVEPVRFTAVLKEPAVTVDPTSNQDSEQLPTYNAYSIDGEVIAPLIYVNYGIPDDYEELEKMGISVSGSIVIARYGGSWRGIKPKVAAEHGAVGCLIFSDPQDDGYYEGDVFPDGPWRPKDGVQRGSVMDMPLYPGDPQTPAKPSTKNAPRIPLKEIKTLTSIPVLPLSYADATPLLAALDGPVAPDSWRGGLGQTYHIGPGPAKVRLMVKANWDVVELHNVVARIPGSEFPDEWILRGNHHDAWVNGAQDPVSGLAALLEEARAFGTMLHEGWTPKRTIVYCAWDGEEEGLLGSTEWVEAHADELRQHAVLYINSDSNSRGYLGIGGSHSLEKFINEVARDIIDPETQLSVWKRAQLRKIANTNSAADRSEVRQRTDLRINALGSGSDYTAFVDHLGIASLNLGYGGEDKGGIYHSIYDDFYWYTHFSDTAFVYGRALAQTAGTAVLRSAMAGVLPFEFMNFAEAVGRYVTDVQKLLSRMRDEVAERNKLIEEGVFIATADPREVMAAPAVERLPPYLNFAPLENAVDSLKRSAQRYGKAASGVDTSMHVAPEKVNRMLMQAEQTLTLKEGLPDRPWFTHAIYAPGFYTGYGVKTLPGVREAIEQKNWARADEQVVKLSRILNAEAALIDAAAKELENNMGKPGRI